LLVWDASLFFIPIVSPPTPIMSTFSLIYHPSIFLSNISSLASLSQPLDFQETYLPWCQTLSRFNDNGHHFSSPTESKMPAHLPAFQELCSGATPSELLQQRWASRDHPYLAFLFKSPFFGSLMSRFSIPASLIKLKNGTNGWHPDTALGKDWAQVENLLIHLESNLLSRFRSDHPGFQLPWVVPARPKSFGYFKPAVTEAQARQVLSNTIDAFVVYSAYISFLAALCWFLPYYRTPPPPKDVLAPIWPSQGNTSISLEDLFGSGIGCSDRSLRPHRVGIVIDLTRCPWINLIPVMIKVDIPLWFYWGKSPLKSYTNWLRHYLPNLEYNPFLHYPIPANHTRPSKADNANGHRSGEHWRDFFKRRKQDNLVKDKNPNAWQVRLDREKSRAQGNLPSSKAGVNYYHWENVDGLQVRTKITYGKAEQI